MTPDEFKAWRSAMKLTQGEAASALGVSRASILNYERGSRREDERPVEIPVTVALACAAISEGLSPWPIDRRRRFDPDREDTHSCTVVDIFEGPNGPMGQVRNYVWTNEEAVVHHIDLLPDRVPNALRHAETAARATGKPVRINMPAEISWSADWGTEPK